MNGDNSHKRGESALVAKSLVKRFKTGRKPENAMTGEADAVNLTPTAPVSAQQREGADK